MRKNLFTIRAPLDWNNLPQETAQSKTIDEFKWKLDKHWKAIGIDMYEFKLDFHPEQSPDDFFSKFVLLSSETF